MKNNNFLLLALGLAALYFITRKPTTAAPTPTPLPPPPVRNETPVLTPSSSGELTPLTTR
jgi:hypothetical protein